MLDQFVGQGILRSSQNHHQKTRALYSFPELEKLRSGFNDHRQREVPKCSCRQKTLRIDFPRVGGGHLAPSSPLFKAKMENISYTCCEPKAERFLCCCCCEETEGRVFGAEKPISPEPHPSGLLIQTSPASLLHTELDWHSLQFQITASIMLIL